MAVNNKMQMVSSHDNSITESSYRPAAASDVSSAAFSEVQRSEYRRI